jgi:hypothetical protein
VWWFRRRVPSDGFPKEFNIQPIGIDAAKRVANLPPAEIVNYFRDHPNTAKNLLTGSYDKRCSPSSFITEKLKGFQVGRFRRAMGMSASGSSSLADAATDYLLLSRGKGRWTSPGT